MNFSVTIFFFKLAHSEDYGFENLFYPLESHLKLHHLIRRIGQQFYKIKV